MGITATIITFNEQDRIAGAIRSLSCCDEIVVVDSGSTDRTREIAAECGARVIEHAWEGYSRQKNFAAAQAKNDWILSIDADERVSVELAGEIASLTRSLALACRLNLGTEEIPPSPNSTGAWSMPRRAFYLGRWINHSGWYPDRKIRLYDRRHARWAGDFVHEALEVDGRVGNFTGDILHFPYRSWQDHIARIDRYTRLASEAAKKNGRGGNVLKLLLAPPLTFIKVFFLQAGFLDGWRGLAIAYMAARYVFLREFRILR
ncbi:MAG: glycosyltransferase family 2 protein [Acidobacteria bacterium]|nr:glycosyltransferase family 2 protein [Acidobacteriota bacterium]